MYCLINGHRAIPTGSVKVTLENQRVKSSGEYTYDISFPLDMPENIEAFGLMGRVDVSKAVLEDFDDCKFFGANQLLVVGTGTVTGITDTTLKLQIVGGKSSLAYRLQKEDPWIDQLNYPALPPFYQAWMDAKYLQLRGGYAQGINTGEGIRNNGYAGIRGQFVCFTVVNDQTGQPYNQLLGSNIRTQNPTWWLRLPAFQPNLMYVFEKVWSALGYNVLENVFNVSPWTDLYILNLHRSKTIAGMLPHWKVKTFLDEFRLLFNANYIVDDIAKTVRVVRASSITEGTVVKAEVADEFSMDYDEDGLTLESTDNLRYDLQTAAEPLTVDEITPEQMASLNLLTFATRTAMDQAMASQTDTYKLTHLFFCQDTGYWYYRKTETDGNLVLAQAAMFNQLTREGNDYGGATTSLRMVPAPFGYYMMNGDVESYNIRIDGPCMMGPSVDPVTSAEEEEEELITVQEVLEDGLDAGGLKDTEDDVMLLAFLGCSTFSWVNGFYDDFTMFALESTTDPRIALPNKRYSLALVPPVLSGTQYIGQLHTTVPSIDRTHQMVYKLLVQGDIPSPSSVFLIRGHRYLCSKLELTVNAAGIDQVISGTFHEILA